MKGKELYDYRKANGLCVACGCEINSGAVRCDWCQKKVRLQQKERFARMTDSELKAYKDYQKAYQKEYRKKHQISKEYKSEHNRIYREKNPTCLFLNKERYVNLNGEIIRLVELSKRVGINYNTLYGRLFKQGLSLTEAIVRG